MTPLWRRALDARKRAGRDPRLALGRLPRVLRDGLRFCQRCRIPKPADEYSPCGPLGGKRASCKSCRAAAARRVPA